MGELTALLADADLETRVRLDRAFELLYPELQVIARSRLRRHGGANVTGTGQILAAGTTQQTLTRRSEWMTSE